MGNKITDQLKIGTIGELLVQLRLLQYNVQAAAPMKDSGNDLIAVRGEEFRGIQVKTTTGIKFSKPRLPRHYHILALVKLMDTDADLLLDTSSVYLISRAEYELAGGIPKNLNLFKINEFLVDELFSTQ